MCCRVSFGSESRQHGTGGKNNSFLVKLMILTDFNFSFLGQEIFNESKKNATDAFAI